MTTQLTKKLDSRQIERSFARSLPPAGKPKEIVLKGKGHPTRLLVHPEKIPDQIVTGEGLEERKREGRISNKQARRDHSWMRKSLSKAGHHNVMPSQKELDRIELQRTGDLFTC